MSDTANDRMTAAEYRNETESEENIHRNVIAWADRQAAAEPALEMLFHVPNGGSRHIAEATKLRDMGTRAGVPDLLLPAAVARGPEAAWKGLALELKSPSGRLRPEQAWWLRRLEGQGWAVAVAWTFGEARTVIQKYLGGEHEPQESLDLSIAEAPGHVAG